MFSNSLIFVYYLIDVSHRSSLHFYKVRAIISFTEGGPKYRKNKKCQASKTDLWICIR